MFGFGFVSPAHKITQLLNELKNGYFQDPESSHIAVRLEEAINALRNRETLFMVDPRLDSAYDSQESSSASDGQEDVLVLPPKPKRREARRKSEMPTFWMHEYSQMGNIALHSSPILGL